MHPGGGGFWCRTNRSDVYQGVGRSVVCTGGSVVFIRVGEWSGHGGGALSVHWGVLNVYEGR